MERTEDPVMSGSIYYMVYILLFEVSQIYWCVCCFTWYEKKNTNKKYVKLMVFKTLVCREITYVRL